MAVSGLNRLMRRFEQLPKEIQEDVKDIIEEETLAIQREAIQNAPAAGDSLSTTYGTQKINTGINQFIGASISPTGLSGEVLTIVPLFQTVTSNLTYFWNITSGT